MEFVALMLFYFTRFARTKKDVFRVDDLQVIFSGKIPIATNTVMQEFYGNFNAIGLKLA